MSRTTMVAKSDQNSIQQRTALRALASGEREKFDAIVKQMAGKVLAPQVMSITPALAAALLERNDINRPIRRGHVDFLVRQIREGRWQMSHQGLAISPRGMLLDGQHRLEAITITGETLPMLVTFNVPEEAFKIIDTGNASRSLSDVTGFNRRILEPISFLQWMTMGKQNRVTVDDLAPMHAAFYELSKSLHEFCSDSRRGISTTPIRAAALYVAKTTGDDTHPFSNYRALVTQKYNDMSESVQSLNRQVLNATGRTIHRLELFARATIAFDPEKQDLTKIQIKDLSTKVDQIRARLIAIRKDHVKKVWPIRSKG